MAGVELCSVIGFFCVAGADCDGSFGFAAGVPPVFFRALAARSASLKNRPDERISKHDDVKEKYLFSTSFSFR